MGDGSYKRRQPEKTVLYQVLAAELETFLRDAHANPARSLPRFVERELRGFADRQRKARFVA